MIRIVKLMFKNFFGLKYIANMLLDNISKNEKYGLGHSENIGLEQLRPGANKK